MLPVRGGAVLPVCIFYQSFTLNDHTDVDDNEACCKQVHCLLSLLLGTAAAVT